MADQDVTSNIESAATYHATLVGSPLPYDNLLPDFDDGQFDSNGSEYESAEEVHGRYAKVVNTSSAAAEAMGLDPDTLAMPPPATKLGGFPWHNSPRVASKDINNTEEPDEMPHLEDVTNSLEYSISQEALEEAAADAKQLAELESVLGIYPDFDMAQALHPALLDSILEKCGEFEFVDLCDEWTESYTGLMKGFAKYELFRKIVMRAARDVRCHALLGPGADDKNKTTEDEKEDSARRKWLNRHKGDPKSGNPTPPSTQPPLKEALVQLEDMRYVDAVKGLDDLQQQNKQLKEELEAVKAAQTPTRKQPVRKSSRNSSPADSKRTTRGSKVKSPSNPPSDSEAAFEPPKGQRKKKKKKATIVGRSESDPNMDVDDDGPPSYHPCGG